MANLARFTFSMHRGCMDNRPPMELDRRKIEIADRSLNNGSGERSMAPPMIPLVSCGAGKVDCRDLHGQPMSQSGK
ncbi:MAG: hypothetical protein OXC72_08620 [Roseovarius sp.]|nr:hypothetical protein [Roseovarius sp.]MCY4291805.1 hypothetical protein [Roseovarius sp.]MCY4314851.1 hypothetical protein [Roseovarius sp.]